MGYELHITRAADWSDSGAQPITLEERRAYIRSDPDMRFDGHAEATTPEGATIRIDGEGLCVWTGYSGGGVDGERAWFDLRGGVIVVKNPDDEIIAKMKAIARALDARVQGDDGEHYDDGDDAAAPAPQYKASRWRRLLG